MNHLDRQMERMMENSRRRDYLLCQLCGIEIQETNRERCIICKVEGCKFCMKRIDDGENQGYVCGPDCEAIARAPEIRAAKRAASTGSSRDLHNYIKLRKAAS